jgi:hypothetical protein
MGFPSSISKTTLPDHIEKSGTLLLFPCEHCARLNKQCIKSIISKCCSECTHFNCCHYTEMSSSNLAWKKLLEAQNSLDEQEEATLAKLLRLRKQRNLLKKQAGEFLQTDIKDVKGLERLEEEENHQREDAEHSARLAATAESISFNPSTVGLLSKSQLNEILAQISPSASLSAPGETVALPPDNSSSS